jgi:hypothetical protein
VGDTSPNLTDYKSVSIIEWAQAEARRSPSKEFPDPIVSVCS